MGRKEWDSRSGDRVICKITANTDHLMDYLTTEKKQIEAIAQWGDRMNQGVKEASRWIKNRNQPLAKLIDGAKRTKEVCENKKNVLGERLAVEPGAKEARKERMKKNLIDPLQDSIKNMTFPRWTENDLKEGMREAFNNVRGAGNEKRLER